MCIDSGFTPGVAATVQTSPYGTSFRSADNIAVADANKINQMKNWNASCETFLESIGTTGARISFAAGIVQFYDGSTSDVPMSAMYMFTSLASAAQGLNQTISQFLLSKNTYDKQGNLTGGVKAVAQLNGDMVFLNPGYFGGNAADDLTTIMHELIHNVTGITDDQITQRFGSSLDSLLQKNKCP